jgi:2-keto-3-deoxy-6-phosphogluconate aldolase
MGSNLIRKDLLEAGDYKSITEKVSQVLDWIQQARGK